MIIETAKQLSACEAVETIRVHIDLIPQDGGVGQHQRAAHLRRAEDIMQALQARYEVGAQGR